MTTQTSYTATVAPGQQLFISYQNGQTRLAIASSESGQQQSQSSSFTSGEWRSTPALYCTSTGVVLHISGQQGDTWLQLQGQQMQQISAPIVVESDRVELEAADAPPSMQPMKMGEMEMHPMRMKMGSMEMQMGNAEPESAAAKFCSQCGQPVESGDRFCANCGHQLIR